MKFENSWSDSRHMDSFLYSHAVTEVTIWKAASVDYLSEGLLYEDIAGPTSLQ